MLEILDWIMRSATSPKGIFSSLSIGDLLKFGGVAAAMWTFAMTNITFATTKSRSKAGYIALVAAILFWSGVIFALTASIRNLERIAPRLIDVSCTMYLTGAITALLSSIMFYAQVYAESNWKAKMEKKHGVTVVREPISSSQNDRGASEKYADIEEEKEPEQ